jgi:hypothetical protein
MATNPTAYWLGFYLSALFAGLIVGGASGLIPLLFGEYGGEAKLGRKAFLFSVLAGLIGGFIAAVPVALGFTVAIVRRKRTRRRSESVHT